MASAQTMQSRQHKNPNIDKLVELGDKIFEKYEAKKDQIADADTSNRQRRKNVRREV